MDMAAPLSGRPRDATTHGAPRAWPLVAVAVLGLALVAAPVVFQMFSRAPAGGDMIDDFTPYMTEGEIETFRGYLDTVGAADDEAANSLLPAIASRDAAAGPFPAVASLHGDWPAIESDMVDLLDTMDDNLGHFDSVASLPPFALFPWFFVVPGLAVVVLAVTALRRGRRALVVALVVLGLGIVSAPALFQMFTRAPDGAAMIDDFRPMMTQERVTRVQGYFVTMGAAEGELRNRVQPAVAQADPSVATDEVAAFSDQWPTIVGDFAPMIATMSDNVDNFAGIAALPRFSLFPWFFVLPGLLIAGLATFGLAQREPSPRTPERT